MKQDRQQFLLWEGGQYRPLTRKASQKWDTLSWYQNCSKQSTRRTSHEGTSKEWGTTSQKTLSLCWPPVWFHKMRVLEIISNLLGKIVWGEKLCAHTQLCVATEIVRATEIVCPHKEGKNTSRGCHTWRHPHGGYNAEIGSDSHRQKRAIEQLVFTSRLRVTHENNSHESYSTVNSFIQQ